MLKDILDLDDLVERLETLQGYCEWDYSIIYSISVDKVIELIKQVQKDETTEKK